MTFENIKKEKLGKKIWTFINSNFGLWLLEPVLLGTVFVVIKERRSDAKNHKIEINEKEKNIELLELEISGRIDQFQSIYERRLDSLSFSGETPDVKEIWLEFKKIPKDSYLSFHSLYAESSEKDIIQLISELSVLIIDDVEKNKLRHISELISTNKLIPVYVDDPLKTVLSTVDSIKLEVEDSK